MSSHLLHLNNFSYPFSCTFVPFSPRKIYSPAQEQTASTSTRSFTAYEAVAGVRSSSKAIFKLLENVKQTCSQTEKCHNSPKAPSPVRHCEILQSTLWNVGTEVSSLQFYHFLYNFYVVIYIMQIIPFKDLCWKRCNCFPSKGNCGKQQLEVCHDRGLNCPRSKKHWSPQNHFVSDPVAGAALQRTAS